MLSNYKKSFLAAITVIALTMFALLISSCKEIEELTHFYFDLETTADIPSTEVTDVPLEILLSDIPTYSEKAFTLNNTTQSLVDNIKLTKLLMTLPESGNQTFDFLSSIEIYIFTDSLPEVLLAKNTAVPETGLKSIDFETTEKNLKDYLILEDVSFKVIITLRNDITEDTNIEIESTFFVDAELLGI